MTIAWSHYTTLILTVVGRNTGWRHASGDLRELKRIISKTS